MTENPERMIKTKKTYRSPELRTYGDLGTLTGSTGTMSKQGDTGMGTNNKT